MHVELIFCDFVRVEANGKHMIIGVYPDDIVMIPQLPGPVALTLWMRVRGLAAGKYHFQTTLVPPEGGHAATLNGSFEITHPALPLAIYAGPNNIFAEQHGYANAHLAVRSEDGLVEENQRVGTIFIGSLNNA